MKHELSITKVVGDGEIMAVSCSCGMLHAHTMTSVERDVNATSMAISIGNSHLAHAAVLELIADEHVVLPKEPTSDDIILLSYDFGRATVQQLKDTYKAITSHGKDLTKLIKPEQK